MSWAGCSGRCDGSGVREARAATEGGSYGSTGSGRPPWRPAQPYPIASPTTPHLLPLPLRAEGDRPADGRRLRGVLAHHRVPEDLVQLEVVHPVVVAEVHLLRPGRAVGELVVLHVEINLRGLVLVRREVGLVGEAVEHRP